MRGRTNRFTCRGSKTTASVANHILDSPVGGGRSIFVTISGNAGSRPE